MSKRRADKQLTRDDLDREDSPEKEEPQYTGSVFASADVLSKRKIITARRSLPSNSSATKASPFASINLTPSGLSSSSSNTLFGSSATPFASTSGSSAVNSQSLFQSSSSSMFRAPAFGSTMNKYQPLVPSPLTTSNPSVPVTNGSISSSSESKKESTDRDPEFYAKMQSLNRSFQNHMNSHLEKEADSDYSNNCQEYIDYVIKLQNRYPIKSPAEKVSPVATTSTSSATTKSQSFFQTPAPTASTSVFLVPAAPPAISFPTSIPQSKVETADDDDYVPPKNEEVNVEEEGAVYSKR